MSGKRNEKKREEERGRTNDGGDLASLPLSLFLFLSLFTPPSNSPQPSSEASITAAELLLLLLGLHPSSAQGREARRRRDLLLLLLRRRRSGGLLLLPLLLRAWRASKRPAAWIRGSASAGV